MRPAPIVTRHATTDDSFWDLVSSPGSVHPDAPEVHKDSTAFDATTTGVGAPAFLRETVISRPLSAASYTKTPRTVRSSGSQAATSLSALSKQRHSSHRAVASASSSQHGAPQPLTPTRKPKSLKSVLCSLESRTMVSRCLDSVQPGLDASTVSMGSQHPHAVSLSTLPITPIRQTVQLVDTHSPLHRQTAAPQGLPPVNKSKGDYVSSGTFVTRSRLETPHTMRGSPAKSSHYGVLSSLHHSVQSIIQTTASEPLDSGAQFTVHLPQRDDLRGVPIPQLLREYRAVKGTDAAVFALQRLSDASKDIVVRAPCPSHKEFARRHYSRFRNAMKSRLLGPFASSLKPGVDPDPAPVFDAAAAISDDFTAVSETELALADTQVPLCILFRRHSYVFVKRLDLSVWAPRVRDKTLTLAQPCLNQVTHANFAKCDRVLAFGWRTPLSTMSRLVWLDVSGNTSFPDEGLVALSHCCRTLVHLNVSGTRVSGAGLAPLIHAVSSSLRTLVLDDCSRITEASWLLTLHSVTVLSLRGCTHIDFGSTVGLVSNLHELRELRLSRSCVDDEAIVDMLFGLNTGGKRATGFKKAAPVFKWRLTSLSVSGCPYLSSDGLMNLTKSCCHHLTTLDASELGFLWPLRAFEEFLNSCTGLTSLSLAHSPLTDDHITGLGNLKQLRVLDMSGCVDATPDAWTSWTCSTLTDLNVSGCVPVDDSLLPKIVGSWRAGGANVCLHAGVSASQSSTCGGRIAMRALAPPSIKHPGGRAVTSKQVAPWWEVDFGTHVSLDSVTIHHDMFDVQPGGSESIRLCVLLSPRVIHGDTVQSAIRSVKDVEGHVFHNLTIVTTPVLNIYVPDSTPCRYLRIQAYKDYKTSLVRRLARTNKAVSHVRLSLHSVACHEAGTRSANFAGTSLTDSGLEFLSSKAPRLRELHLNGCKYISDEGVIKLLARCTTLQILSLSGTAAITPACIRAISNKCSFLRELHCSAWPYTETRDNGKRPPIVELIRPAVGSNPDHVFGLTDKSLVWIANGCSFLRVLDMSGAQKVSTNGLSALTSLTSLEMLDCTLVPSATLSVLTDIASRLYGCDAVVAKLVTPLAKVSHQAVAVAASIWTGVRKSDDARCRSMLSDIIRTEKLEQIAADMIQSAWRRCQEDRVTRLRFSIASHWRLSKGLEMIHGNEGVDLPKPLKSMFITIGVAAVKIMRWWRRKRRYMFERASVKIQNAWKWNRHRRKQRMHIGALKLQKLFRCYIARCEVAHLRWAVNTLQRYARRVLLESRLRLIRPIPAIRRRVHVWCIQRAWRRRAERVKFAEAKRKGLRVMAQSLMFWVMGVNLKYLWGRRMIEKNALIKRRQEAALLIQRTWIRHVSEATVTRGWNYAKIMALARHERKSRNAIIVQRFVRRTFLRRSIVDYVDKLRKGHRIVLRSRDAPAYVTELPQVFTRKTQEAGNHSHLKQSHMSGVASCCSPDGHKRRHRRRHHRRHRDAAAGRSDNHHHRPKPRHRERKRVVVSSKGAVSPSKPVKVFTEAEETAYRKLVAGWLKKVYRDDQFFVRNALIRWAARARVNWPTRWVTPVQRWWRAVLTRKRTSVSNRAMILYRFARQYTDWRKEHPEAEEAQQDDVSIPLGVGDNVRCRYRGGVYYYSAIVIAVHWGSGVNDTKPLSYSVRYVTDKVVEHDVPREHLRISQKAFTRLLIEAPINNRVLLKDMPVLHHRQPQRLTDFERRNMFLASREATIDFNARAKLDKPAGVVDLRIVAGEHENKAMLSAQYLVTNEDDKFTKVPVDMRHRKRQYRDSDAVHLWTKSSNDGPFITRLAVLNTVDLLTHAAHAKPLVTSLLKQGFTDVIWPNRTERYSLAMFYHDRGTEAMNFPSPPKFGVKFALAVKWGTGDGLPPIGDVAVSTSRALSMMTSSEGVMSENMLFCSRYMPLPENLGMYGVDEACRIWIRWGLSSKSARIPPQLLRKPELVTPNLPTKGSYIARFTERKQAELEAAFDSVMKESPKPVPAPEPAVPPLQLGPKRSTAQVFASMVTGKARDSMMLKKLRDIKDTYLPKPYEDNVVEGESESGSDESDDGELRSDDDSDVSSYSEGTGYDANDRDSQYSSKYDGSDSGIESEDSVSSDSSVTSMSSRSTFKGDYDDDRYR